MRILQLRFKNLNALAGEWAIDFTAPPYRDNGIFAITGPTGAGKTTILDALCLALYGRTPRLGKISKKANEVMTRQSGDCFAEVVFETAAGRFRCHWAQHRARRRAAGELQHPRHEIVDHDTDKVLATKIAEVAAKVERATGMDFERFTRSMLLAQGGFAAFLQAAPDERAPILEQITGTGIYSDISKMVHQRKSEEDQWLQELQAELDGMQLLDEAAVEAIENELAAHRSETARLERAIAERERGMAWLRRIAELEREQASLGQKKAALAEREQAFAPERERFALARRALELEADFVGLLSQRELLQRQRREHEELTRRIGAAEQSLSQAVTRQEAAEKKQRTLQVRQQALADVLPQVRELDRALENLAASLARQQADHRKRSGDLDALMQERKRNEQARAEKAGALARLRTELERYGADEALVTELEGLRVRVTALRRRADESAAAREKRDRLTGELARARGLAERSAKEKAAQEERARELADALEEKRAALATLLRERPLADWRKESVALSGREAALKQLAQFLCEVAEAAEREEALAARREVLEAQQARENATREQAAERQRLLQEQLDALEKNRLLAQRIESLEAARRELEEGEPCPLCGSREHPWASHEIERDDSIGEKIARTKARLGEAVDAVRAAEHRLVALGKDREQLEKEMAANGQRRAELTRAIDAALDTLGIDAEGGDREQIVAAALAETRRARDEIAEIVADAETLRQTLEGLGAEEAAARKAAHEADRRYRDLLADVKLREQESAHLGKMLSALNAEVSTETRALAEAFSRFGVAASELAGLEEGLSALETRRQRWLDKKRAEPLLEQEIARLESAIAMQQRQQEVARRELARLAELLEEQQAEMESRRQRRQSLFGDENPDEVERDLAAELEAALAALHQARLDVEREKSALQSSRQRAEALADSLAEAGKALESRQDAFARRLAAAGFADEAAFVAARLAESERDRLEAEAKALDKERAALDDALKRLAGQLDAARAEKVTEEKMETLEAERERLRTELETVQQQTGQLRERLDNDRLLRRRQAEKAEAIGRQRRECERWALLHNLIGSADGKKYRNFAQGLTFEMMVSHANRQLTEMTDRYLLVRDETQPLELNVIDNYQAGEIRSTKNLSGGESFIVSLALALGLSGMASRNVRVDSLFLDEGFGTLDDDALETALATLSGLHRQGKVIGVISHVAALKERIPTQIQVTPLAGGRSELSGPGCQRLDGG